MQQSKRTKYSLVANPVTAATTDITTSIVDMAGFRGASFSCVIGAATTSATFKVQQAAATSGAWSDVTGATVTIAGDDDNSASIVDVNRPIKRYLRGIYDSGSTGGNQVFGGILAQQYDPMFIPTSTTALNAAASVSAAT